MGEKALYSLNRWTSTTVYSLEYIKLQLSESFASRGYLVINDKHVFDWQSKNQFHVLFDQLAFLDSPKQLTIYSLVNSGWHMYKFYRVQVNCGEEMQQVSVLDLRVIDRVKQAVVRARL